MISNTNGAGWVATTETFLQENATGSVYGLADTGETEPVAVKQMAMVINVAPALDSKKLDFKNEVNLDGKFTIEIKQL
jgi:hypothetical protein